MEDREDNRRDPDSDQENPSDPLKWIESLSQQKLRDWLRLVIWLRTPFPVDMPVTSRLAVEVSDHLKQGSPGLKTRVRSVIPELLQEWGRDDPSSALDDMLIICGRLRCAAAEPAIVLIVSERLGGRDEEVELRQRCLSVLSGFGCTERTVHVFQRYIGDIEYASICYRALSRFNPLYAATELPLLFKIHREGNALEEFNFILRTLFRDYPKPSERLSILILYLKHSKAESFSDVLRSTISIDALTSDILLQCQPGQRQEFFRLLLELGQSQDLTGILWALNSIGVEFHSFEPEEGLEYIECLYENRDEGVLAVERICSSDELSDNTRATIIEVGEKAALVWADDAAGDQYSGTAITSPAT